MAGETLINHSMNRAEWLALLLLSVLWGGSFFFSSRPDQGVTALYDRVPARRIGRGDPERIGEGARNENARQP